MDDIIETLTEMQKLEEIERIQTSIDMKYRPSKSSLIWEKKKNKGNRQAQNLRYRQRLKIKKEEERQKLEALGYVQEPEVGRGRPKVLISVKAIKVKPKISKLDPTSESVLIKMREQIKEEKDRKLRAKTEISEQEWKDYQAQRKAMGLIEPEA